MILLKISNLYIKDFGVFRNEKIENMHSDIVVIGGNNRAGKTTFMNIFRYFPFGFPKGSNVIPNANVNYEVEAELLVDKERYSVLTSGFKSPRVTNLDSKVPGEIEQLFGKIDFFTYKQLFSLTLDELQNNKSTNSEMEIMKTIFLGAGYKEMVALPKLIKELKKEAIKIGGKNGSPSIGQFKLYNTEIKKGIEKRNEASKQIEVYQNYKEELNKIKLNIGERKNKIFDYKNKSFRVDIIRNNYDLYSDIKELQMILEHKKSLDEKENRLLLIKNIDLIDKATKETDFIKEKIKDYNEINRNNRIDKENINREISHINSKWIGNFEKIVNIRVENSAFEELSKSINNYKEKLKEKELLLKERNKVSNEINLGIANKKREMNELRKNNIIKYFYISLVILACGMLLSFVNKTAGIGTILFGIFFGVTFIIIKFNVYNNTKNKLQSIKEILIENNALNKNLEDEISNLDREISICMNKLENYRVLFDLGNDVDYEYLRTQFLNIRELKHRIEAYYKSIYNGQALKEKIISKFSEIKSNLRNKGFQIPIEFEEDELMENHEYISEYTINLREQANEAFKIENIIEKKKVEYDVKVNSLSIALDKDRIKELMGKEENESLIMGFKRLANNYISKEEVIKEGTILEEKISFEQKELDKLLREKERLCLKVENLSTLKNFNEAQNTIDSSRKALYPIARKYAIYKASINILEELQKEFVEKTQNKLLSGASEILYKITSGGVNEILPHQDIMKYDFITRDQSGKIFNSSELLSRGTKEQLFLSMRMNRIREYKPSIPVVFDDSFVNFDEKSLYNTGVIINQISKTNQIFILTCHSRVVDFISKTNKNAKYLFLDSGKFQETDSRELINKLKNF